jgi:hypothetical protein
MRAINCHGPSSMDYQSITFFGTLVTFIFFKFCRVVSLYHEIQEP